VTDVTLLRSLPLFVELTDEEIELLGKEAMARSLERNDVIFREGDEPDELVVVVEGRIAIIRSFVDGRESVLALMEDGDCFGEMGLFGGAGRSTDARALEPTEVLTIPYGPLREIYNRRPELLWHVAEVLADRLRVTDEALADSMFLDVAGRTAKRLLEMSGGDEEFVLPVTQEELAGMVGASRERVNKALASFVRLGWLAQAERRYKILDREALERRAN
jgi:CRP/FNR family transcriptional regulator, cyclic AMP receptor protein